LERRTFPLEYKRVCHSNVRHGLQSDSQAESSDYKSNIVDQQRATLATLHHSKWRLIMGKLLRLSAKTLRGALLFAAASWIPEARAQSVSPCRALDEGGQATLNWVRTTATGTDSSAITSRTNLKIPQVAASKVSYVTDARLCQQAVNAYSAAAGVPATGRSVYLVKVGTVYVIKDPTVFMGEWWYSMTADSKWKILAKFTG
jgi:hypothetical protein